MLPLLALAASANAACGNLGKKCAGATAWYGICTSTYQEDWGANEVDAAGNALNGKLFGNVCPASCAGFDASAQGGVMKSCEEWMSSDLSYDVNTNTEAPQSRPTYVLEDGSIVYGECVAKPDLANSLMAVSGAHCVKDEVVYDEGKCNAFQQFCDWKYTGFPSSSEYKRIPESQLFAETADCSSGKCPQVDPSLYSAKFGLFPPGKKDFFWHALDTDGSALPPRESKWVMWHYDVLTSPSFTLTDCDCLDSEKVEGPSGWFTNSDCDEFCTRDKIGAEDKLYKVITVHDRVCHREVDLDGVRWDPSPNMNYLMPLDKIFPTRLGKGQDCPGPDCQLGLNMQRGEGGASWYWWGHAKNSWNDNDQSSHVAAGELTFDSEHECQKYAETYWDVKGMNTDFHSVCDRFSSKTSCTDVDGNVIVTNSKCAAACDSRNTEHNDWFISEGLINHDGSAASGLSAWFHDNCVYTPYQPENDHAWPNFYVPEINQCFSQWQIGFEDQGCDACMHPLYDNTDAFNGGWSYKPIDGFGVDPSSEGYGNCTAQCGKIIMDGPGRPRDVKSAQECQDYCQNDPNCVHFQWRPIPDWAKASESAWSANKFNQVRSCLLKNRAQFEGSLRARWGADGQWIFHPEEDQHAFANQYQNLDCAQGTTGEAWNWCLGCRDTDGQVTYHSWKWRNNMISGPKFCDTPKISHGNVDRLDSPYWDSEKTPLKIDDCPAYDMKVPNPTPNTTSTLYNLDGTEAPQYCVAKEGLSDLAGGIEWAEHCVAANRMYDLSTARSTCEKFQQYCEWTMDFKIPTEDYKRATESALGIAPTTIVQNNMSSTFGLHPPCEDVCEITDSSVMDPSLVGVCTPPETCTNQWTTVGGYKNDLPSRDGGWVFWHHEELGVIHRLGCDCLEDPSCSPQCDRIANDADIYTVHFLADRVCHRENDVMSTRWDPSPNMQTLTNVFEEEWGSLGMVPGESGSSWYWYGASKPSWNNWDQTSHVGKGEMVFATESECRAFATSYWTNMGYPAFDSVCTQFSSKTPGVSNAMCEAACDSDNNSFDFVNTIGDVSNWIKQNCEYTPYHAENDFAWPNVFVPDSNECFGQWQIGYEDQGCDGCLHSAYDNSEAFDFGWSYAPSAESGIPPDVTGTEGEGTGEWSKGYCSAQCGKIITDGPGKFKDVKNAQECQNYCQNDDRCVHWQWRSTPDYTAAQSVDQTGYVNENNRVNKIRSCLLKSSDQVMGALEARWDESGTFVDGSSPDWDGVSNWEAGAPYNQFSSGQYQIDDSQHSKTGEGANWYLECKDTSDFSTAGTKTTHSWKWRNNMVSGPKYCGAGGTGRIYHGATIPEGSPFIQGKDTLTSCPTRAQFEFGLSSSVPTPERPGDYNAWPDLTNVPEPAVPGVPDPFQPWKEPSTTNPGSVDTTVACDISSYSFCEGMAWEDACLRSYDGTDLSVAGCAVHCAKRVNRPFGSNSGIISAEEWQTQFAKHDESFSMDHCVYSNFPYVVLATTSTTTTTAPVPKSCQYQTTTTSTTTTEYVPWEPSCPSGDFESINSDSCTSAPGSAADWSGYVPFTTAERDGVFSSGNGTVTITTPRPFPAWCKDTNSVVPLGVGTHDAHEFYMNVGLMKLACVGWTEQMHNEAQAYSRSNPACQEEAGEIFTYRSMALAAGYFPDFLGFDNLKQNQLDLASFFAQTGAETTGGTGSALAGYAWCFSHEQSRDGYSYGNQDMMKCPNCENLWGYGDKIIHSEVDPSNNLDYGYYGRGALQLTHAYNYGAFQLWAEKHLSYTPAEVNFLTHPGLVASEDFGFASSVWFFMSPERENTKPSMHNVVAGWVVNGDIVTFDTISTDQVGRNRDLGYQMNILNGGFECGGKSHPGPGKRVSYFSWFTDKIGFEGDLEAVTSVCKGCTLAPPISGANSFKFWYNKSTGAIDAGDTLHSCSGSGSVAGTSAPSTDTTTTTTTPYCPPFLAGQC